MGGIISKNYLRHYGSEKIAGLCSIGTPWNGTLVHRIGFGKHVHQLSPDSEFCSDSTPLPVPHLSLWSPRDFIVLPSSTADLATPSSVSVSNAGHLSMLFSISVFRKIRDFIHELEKERDEQ